MPQHNSKVTVSIWLNPATERLLSKMTNLEEMLEGFPAQTLNHEQKQIISLNVAKQSEGYVYAVLAIVSGFAADKILRSMIDGVLKRLEQKAEKTKGGEKK